MLVERQEDEMLVQRLEGECWSTGRRENADREVGGGDAGREAGG
jgi:hypothetical protein